MAMTMARRVTTIEMVLAIARLPVEKMAAMRGVIRVAPQVGQPAPRAISPVIMPAFSMFSELVEAFWRFLFQSRTIRPIRIPCKIEIAKIGSQSRKGWLYPKMARNECPRILRDSGKPRVAISSNLVVPPAKRLMSMPKKRKLGTKPYQKRFSLAASKIPLPAKANSSHHFLQFMFNIIAYCLATIYYFWGASVREK